MSGDSWHWLYLSGLSAVSLYASPSDAANVASLQWILPGFESVYAPIWKASPMKGIWGNEKSVNTEYKPAVDALRAIPGELLGRALASVVSDGGALMVAATRDYGAICLTLLQGTERKKVYLSTVQELEQALRDLIDTFEPETLTLPPKKTTR